MEENELVWLHEGAIVHFVHGDEDGEHAKGQHVPAIVTKIWSHVKGMVNVYIFSDFSKNKTVEYRTSRLYDPSKGPGTWHFIEVPKG